MKRRERCVTMRDASSSSPLGDGVARAARANATTTATTAAGDEQAATVSQERLAAPAAPAMQLLVRHKRTVTVDGLRAEDDVSVLAARIERKTRVPRANSWLQFEHSLLCHLLFGGVCCGSVERVALSAG